MFDGWDADIIIPSKKIAIFWNGIFHYKKIFEKQDMEKIKKKDEFKYNLIKTKFNYDVYIIKDIKNKNKGFVENEFIKFVNIYYPELNNKANNIINNCSYKFPKKEKGIKNNPEEIVYEEKKITKKELKRIEKIRKRALIINQINQIRNSNIDFFNEGWIIKVCKLLKIKNGRDWIRRHMPKLWNIAYHRKQETIKFP